MSRPTPAALFALLLAAPAPALTPVEARDAFRRERADAARFHSPDELRAADRLAARAEAAPADEADAVQLLRWREARWAVPLRPDGLPAHVGRVIGAVRLRHAGRVNALSYSPDGARLASASQDGTVAVWDLGSGRNALTYRGHAATDANAAEDSNVFVVSGVSWSPDGKKIASSGGAEIHVWDPRDGRKLQTLAGGHKKAVRAVAWSPDGTRLLSGGDDNAAVLWDAAGKVTWTGPTQASGGRIEGIAWSGDGKLFATINSSGELVVYAAADGKALMSPTVTAANQAGFGVAFGAGGVVTCGGDGRTVLTSLPNPTPAEGAGPGGGTTVRTFGADARPLAERTLGPGEKVVAVAVAGDKWVAAGGGDKTVRVWDAATGRSAWAFQGHTKTVSAVAARPDGGEIASADEGGMVRVWPLSLSDPHRAATESAEPLWAAAVSPDGARFAAAGADKTVRVYDAATAKLVTSLAGHAGAVAALAYLPDGRLLSAGGDRTVKAWDVAKGTATDWEGHTGAVLALAAGTGAEAALSGGVDRTVKGWSAGGKVLWTWPARSAVSALAARPGGPVAVGHANGTLALLRTDAAGAKLQGIVPAHTGGVAACAFSPDGTRLATAGGDGAVRLWVVPATGAPTSLGRWEPASRETASPPVAAVAFSADGRYVASGGADGVARVWDVRSGGEVRALRGSKDWVTAVAFRPDGGALFAAGADRAARLFELAEPSAAPAEGHGLAVRGVAVSTDGKRLVTASEDYDARVWDLETGKPVAALRGATQPLNAAAFVSPDEVAAVGDDNRLHVWNVGTRLEVRSVAVGGAGFVLAAGNGGLLTLAWANGKQGGIERLRDGMPAAPPVIEPNREVRCAAVTGDGPLAAIGGQDGLVRVYDVATREPAGADWKLTENGLFDIALTADGKKLVALEPDGSVTVGDVAARTVAKRFAALTGPPGALALAPDGARVALLGADGTVQVRTLDGALVREWKLPTAALSAAFVPGAPRLVTGNKDGTAYVLELP